MVFSPFKLLIYYHIYICILILAQVAQSVATLAVNRGMWIWIPAQKSLWHSSFFNGQKVVSSKLLESMLCWVSTGVRKQGNAWVRGPAAVIWQLLKTALNSNQSIYTYTQRAHCCFSRGTAHVSLFDNVACLPCKFYLVHLLSPEAYKTYVTCFCSVLSGTCKFVC